MPKQKRPFQVEIEAKVSVLAFDEASARKKVERALAAGRNVGTDVEGTGVVWTYATTGGDPDDASSRPQLPVASEPRGRRPVDPSALLTPGEMSVATLVTQGKPNRKVAAELATSVNTVEYHLKNIYAKLGISSRSQLIVRLGLP